ncbi:hypothetical protein HMP06_3000 [Sphingomonas sp. HMP6]|nr:hypothetical protein HMP06_3000 [Sphingomonas sp. HMP6]
MRRNANPTEACTPRQWRQEALADLKESLMTDAPTFRTVTLDFPLTRGDETVTSVQVRKPGSGELRGLTLMALSQLDYAALETLLPRITMPMLQKADVARLDPADLMQLGGEVMDFLLPKAAKEAASPQA